MLCAEITRNVLYGIFLLFAFVVFLWKNVIKDLGSADMDVELFEKWELSGK